MCVFLPLLIPDLFFCPSEEWPKRYPTGSLPKETISGLCLQWDKSAIYSNTVLQSPRGNMAGSNFGSIIIHKTWNICRLLKEIYI